jgi:hypothetical protein
MPLEMDTLLFGPPVTLRDRRDNDRLAELRHIGTHFLRLRFSRWRGRERD